MMKKGIIYIEEIQAKNSIFAGKYFKTEQMYLKKYKNGSIIKWAAK